MQTTNETTQSWICDVNEEGVLTFPDELWRLMDWKEGDTVEFIDQEDGSFILQKVEDSTNPDYTGVIEKTIPENNDQDHQG